PRKNRRCRVEAFSSAKAEGWPEKALRNDLRLLIVLQAEAATIIVKYSNIGNTPNSERTDLVFTAKHKRRVTRDHWHHLLQSQAKRHERTHRLSEAEARLSHEWMVFLIGMIA